MAADVLCMLSQLGRTGGKKGDAQVRPDTAACQSSTKQFDLECCCGVIDVVQKELERQEKYPNLVEPHRLKGLTVRFAQGGVLRLHACPVLHSDQHQLDQLYSAQLLDT